MKMLIKKEKFVFLLLAFSFLMLVFFYRYHKLYITISGEIIYDEFKKGYIEVYWTTELKRGYPLKKGLTYLFTPGFYELKIPKKYDNIYLCARNKGLPRESFAYFISDPIKIKTVKNDILHYDIILKTKKLLMDSYKGETVKLSGKVLCSQYKKGRIVICIYSPDYFKKIRLPPDIAKVVLAGQGNFNVEVPLNIGKVCIVAINIPEGENSGNSPNCPKEAYINNPVLVRDKDIDGIDITIN